MSISLARLVRPIFGEFEKQEFNKFLRLGAVFACMLGTYCGLRPLKNGLFSMFVGAHHLPWAKAVSTITFLPLILLYTVLLDRYQRERTFYILSAFYAALALLFAIYYFFATGQAQTSDPETATGISHWITLIINFVFYAWVESYATLLLALFWAIATDTTSPESAKKGFSFVVALGQLGGIVGPFIITSLPHALSHETSSLSFVLVMITIGISTILLRRFFTQTPAPLLASYKGENETAKKIEEPGFFEGFRLLINYPYLLGIFAVVAFPDFIATIIDLHFNSLAAHTYTGTELVRFLGYYSSAANTLAFIFLILGAGKITNFFGIGTSLILIPILYGFAIIGFISLNSLPFLFFLLASSKAVNYALNGPAIKQLYIPTTHDVRFKSQAWIETFGSRVSMGSLFNMTLAPLQSKFGAIAGRMRHAMLASYVSFAIILAWIFIAFYLGKKHRMAIQENKVIC